MANSIKALLISFSLIQSFAVPAYAGEIKWMHTFSSTTVDHFQAGVCADQSGNLYVFGEISDTVYCGKQIILSPSKGHSHLFATKFDSSGKLCWSTVLDVSKQRSKWRYCEFNLAVYNGDIYLCAGVDSFAETGGSWSMAAFLAKIDSSGNVSWYKTIDQSGRIAVANGLIHLIGDFYNKTCFEENNCLEIPGGGHFLYTATFDTSGALLGAAVMGYSLYDWRIAASANAYLYANFHRGYFDPLWRDTVNFKMLSEHRTILVKMKNTTTYWSLTVQNLYNSNGLGIDGDGNIYITASLSDTSEIGGVKLGRKGDYSVVILKLDSNKNVLWVKNTSVWCDPGKKCGTIDVTDESARTDSHGNTTLLGFTKRKGLRIENVNLPTNGAFIARFNADGKLLFAENLFTRDVIFGLVQGGDCIYLYDTFTGKSKILNKTLQSRKKGRYDFFVGRYNNT